MPFVLLFGVAAMMTGGGILMGGMGARDAAQGEAQAAEKSTGLVKVVVIGGALYMLYGVARGSGVIR